MNEQTHAYIPQTIVDGPLQVDYAKTVPLQPIPVGRGKSFAGNVATMRGHTAPLIADRKKIRRNDPCPCGKLKGDTNVRTKFKNCCLPGTRPAVEPASSDPIVCSAAPGVEASSVPSA